MGKLTEQMELNQLFRLCVCMNMNDFVYGVYNFVKMNFS